LPGFLRTTDDANGGADDLLARDRERRMAARREARDAVDRLDGHARRADSTSEAHRELAHIAVGEDLRAGQGARGRDGAAAHAGAQRDRPPGAGHRDPAVFGRERREDLRQRPVRTSARDARLGIDGDERHVQARHGVRPQEQRPREQLAVGPDRTAAIGEERADDERRGAVERRR
jgi:hypothetical protein